MRTGRTRRWLAWLACAATIVVLARGSRAEEASLPSPLRPDDVLTFARAHRSEIVVAKSKIAAAAEKPKVVSALPDPMVMASVDHLPIKLMGVDFSVMVQQDFPLSGVLGKKKEGALAELSVANADAKRVSLDVEYEALRAYLMLVELERMAVVIDEQVLLSKQAAGAARARLESTVGSPADVVRAQVDVARLEGERKAIDAELGSAKAMLNAALGRPIDAAIPKCDLSLPDAGPPLLADLVKVALEKRPELSAMKARVEVAQADVKVMQSMYTPMAFVRVGGSYKMDEGAGAMLMVGISIPIFREKLNAGVAGAQAMVSMADADVAAMKKMIEGEVGAARESVVAARTRLTTARENVTPLAKQAFALTLASYGAGQSPLVAVLDAVRTLYEVRLEEVAAEVKVALAWARLGRATGVLKVGPP